MFFNLTIDSDSARTINIADQKKTSKSNHIEHVLGYIPSNTAVDDHQDIELKNSVFCPRYFDVNNQYPNRYLVCGSTLSGKSYFTAMVAKSYKKQHKDNPIFIFSNLDEDPVLDKLKPTRIEISDDLIEEPIELSELADSLCIFDDIDSITDKNIRKAIYDLRDNIMSTGRHHNISVITTSQILLKGQESKQSITNSHQVVLFPGASKHQCYSFLESYMHLDKLTIRKICSVKSRWISISRTNPVYVLHERGFFFI